MMKVRDGMTTVVLAIGPAHTLREASRLMSARRVGAAVVIDPEPSPAGITHRTGLAGPSPRCRPRANRPPPRLSQPGRGPSFGGWRVRWLAILAGVAGVRQSEAPCSFPAP